MAVTLLELIGQSPFSSRVPQHPITDALASLTVQALQSDANGIVTGTATAVSPLTILTGAPDVSAPTEPIPFALRFRGPAAKPPDGFTLDVLLGQVAIELPALSAHLGGALAVRFEAPSGPGPVTVRPFGPPASGVLVPLLADPPAVELLLDPPDVALGPTAFRLHVPKVRLEWPAAGATGPRTVVPSAELHLPWLPAFGELPAISISNLAIEPPVGISARSSVTVDHPPLGPVLIDVDWERPGALTLNDLVPTGVRLTADIPSGLTLPLPPSGASPGPVTAHPEGGGGIRLVASLGPDETGATRVSMQVDAVGTDDGLILLDEDPAATILSIALFLASGLLGPMPVVGSGAAGLAAIVGTAVPLQKVKIGGKPLLQDGRVAVQAVRIDAALSDPVHPIEARIDVTASLAVDVQLGPMRISTRSEGPIRVRYRDLRASVGDGSGAAAGLDAVSISFADVQPELESPGAWQVEGLGDLLRVSGVRSGAGSAWFEIDLVLGIDLGLVKIDTATVRVTLGAGGTPAVEMRGLGVSISVPGLLEGSGVGLIADGRIEAEVSAQLTAIGVSADASFTYEDDPNVHGPPLVGIGIDARFPGPIPLGSSGLGLFGVGGTFAMNARRGWADGFAPSDDPVEREFQWRRDKAYPRFVQAAGVAFGARVVVGTIPDLGVAFNALGSLIVLSPDVTVIVGLDVRFLSGRPGLDDAMPEVGLGISGLLVVDGNGITIGARGSFVVDGLLEAQLPVGAHFGFNGDPHWFIRIGADGQGTPVRGGGPISIEVLPDLIDLSAWAYLMFEGGGLRDLGGKLQIADSGFAIGFGVGWDIEWWAIPLHFRATGEVLVGLATSPWALLGHALIVGSLDLGPVSLSLSSALDVQVGEGRPLWAKGEVCGHVDCFFFEVGGCIGVEIGEPPTIAIAQPPSPLQEMTLVDRTGRILETAVEDAAALPVVWPDAVPVLSFSAWVDTALEPGPFKNKLVAQPPPPVDGWVGSADLAYRFALTKLDLVATKNGQDRVVTQDLWSAWSLPRHGVPFGSPGVAAVAGARELNLLTWEDALWARSLIDGGASAPGDPVASVGAPCLDPPPLECTTLLGGDAHVALGGFAWGSRFQAWRVRGAEITAVGRWSVAPFGVLDLATAPSVAADLTGRFEPGGARWFDAKLSTDEGAFEATWDLPTLRTKLQQGDPSHSVQLTPSIEVLDPILVLSIDPLGQARDQTAEWRPISVTGVLASDLSEVAWDLDVRPAAPAVLLAVIAKPPKPGPWQSVRIDYEPVARVGVVALRGCAADIVADLARDAAIRGEKRAANEALAKSGYPIGRSMLDEGTTYRLTVGMTWQGSGGDRKAAKPPARLPDRVFHFRTAEAGSHGPANAPGSIKRLMRSHNEFDARALLRYVRAFHPAGPDAWHFTSDPITVDLSVDYLEQLVALYQGTLRLRARRVDPPPGTPPPVEPADDDGLITLASPFNVASLDLGDQRLLNAAILSECATPTGGGVTAWAQADLQPHAQYEAALMAIPSAGGALERATVATALFSTSGHASPDALLDVLWMSDGATTGDVRIDGANVAFLAGLESRQGDDAFEAMLVGLGLDPWPPTRGPRVTLLWTPVDPIPTWRFLGLLVEADEPIMRPGRLDEVVVNAAGGILPGRLVDTLGTRLSFLASAPFEPQPGTLDITTHTVEPWNSAAPKSIARSRPMPAGPEWMEEVAP